MRFYSEVIARKGRKYWIGRVKRGKFYPNEELDSLVTMDRLGIKYVTMHEYSKIIGLDLTVAQVNEIRKKTGYTEILVIDQPPPKTNKNNNILDKTWEKWYLRFIHVLCQKCDRNCKQSSRVDLICPSYKEK
ncbi:MAG: hypothetical protein KAS32_01325 [Candidatus Peribacteraceae bacterium]|nr:hypothetical protein [Candidatus Peribacteraceae bacterium]